MQARDAPAIDSVHRVELADHDDPAVGLHGEATVRER
jgi:hypothetical protein